MSLFNKIRYLNGAAIDSIVLTFVRIITVVIGLLITKLLSTKLTLNEYGTYSQAMLIISTATSISILGLTNAVNYFYNSSNDIDTKREYVSTIFGIQYFVGIITAVLILICHASIIHYFKNEELNNILFLVAWMPLLENLLPMLQVLFVSIGKAKIIAVRNFIVSILRLIVVFITCFITKDILTIFFILLIVDVFQIFYFFKSFSKDNFSISFKSFSKQHVITILKFSIPMAIYIMTNSLSRDIDKYIISYFTDTETLAVYMNASKVLPFDMVTASLITVLIPIVTRQVSNKEFVNAKATMKTYLKLGYLLTWILAFGAIIVGKELMLFLYSDKYLEGLSIFIVYLFVDMVHFANTSLLLVASGKTKLLMICSIFSLILNFILNIFSYKLFGIIGPAISTLIVTIGLTFILLYMGAKQINGSITDLFDFNELFTVVLELMIIGFICIKVKNVIYIFTDSTFLVLLLVYILFVILIFLLNKKKIISCLKEVNKLK